MEFINKIELAGIVGQVSESTYAPGVKRFSLMTQKSYYSEGGHAIVNHTWFQCVISENIKGYDKVKPNAEIHLNGEVKLYTYTTSAGEDRGSYEILVKELL